MVVPLLLASAVVLFIAASRRGSSSTANAGAARSGQLYRIQARVPLAYVQAVRSAHGEDGQRALLHDIEQRVEAMGFEDTHLTMQDPTDNELITLITRRTGDERRSPAAKTGDERGSSPVRIVRIDEVDEPPKVDALYVRNKRALDSGLSPEEVVTVRQALLEDMNPRHLAGIAHTFEPFFPVAGSLLRAKAELLEMRKLPDAKQNPALDAALREGLRAVWRLSQGTTAPSVPTGAEPRLLAARTRLQEVAAQNRIPLEIVHDELRRAACMLAQGEDIAKFPPELVLYASLALRDLLVLPDGRSIKIVDPKRLNLIVPPDERRDGFVSPSAIQLALATSKPVQSGVFKIAEAPRIYDSLINAPKTDPRNLKARSQMERANRTLERRRWLEWYRRRTKAGYGAAARMVGTTGRTS